MAYDVGDTATLTLTVSPADGTTVATATATNPAGVTAPLSVGTAYTYAVRARDGRGALSSWSAPEPQAPAAPVEAGPTGAASASADRTVAAQRHADEIIRSGVLTADAVKALSSQLDTLPRADAFEIRRRIADAINKQELIPAELPFDMP